MARHGQFHAHRIPCLSPFSRLAALLVLLLGLLALPSAGHAYSDNDSCPDDVVNGGEDLGYAVEEASTGAPVDPQAIQPVGRTVKIQAVATALGHCQPNYFDYWKGCVWGTREERTVNNVRCWLLAETKAQNGSYFCSLIAGKDPATGTTAFYHVLDSHDATTSTGPLQVSLSSPGTYTVTLTNVINTTTCGLTPATVARTLTLQAYDPLDDKGLGCGGGQGAPKHVGDPCNTATGNNYQREEDYAGPALPFARHYNSQFGIDIGLGYGWTSSYHKRLERYADGTVRVRRADGRSEPFRNTAGTWQGDADSTYGLAQDAEGYTLTRADGGRERYDAAGRLQSETEATGRTTAYAYEAGSRLRQVTGPFGHTLTFAYDANGRLATLTDPAGGQVRYGYDAKGNLLSVTYPDGRQRTYQYESSSLPHSLTGLTDENGQRFATFAYSSDNKVLSAQHATTSNPVGQERVALSYNAAASQTTVTDAVGTQELYTFQTHLGDKNLIRRKTLSDNKTATQTFDAANNLLSHTDPEGRTTTYTYNATHQRLSQTEAAGTAIARTTTYEYLAAGLDLPTRITSPSIQAGQTHETVFAYADPAVGLPTTITRNGYAPDGSPVTRAIHLSYTAQGQLTSLDGPREDLSDLTTFAYYPCGTGGACGQLRSVTNALGQVTTYDAYDTHGHLLAFTDPNGLRTSYTYDLRGRLTTVVQTPPQGTARTTRYAYDNVGQLIQTTFPDGHTLTLGYDAAHDLRTVTDHLGHRISYTYDAKGNRTRDYTSDPDGTLVRALDVAYDLRNHVASLTRGTSLTRQVHDAVGQLVSETDPDNHPATTYGYDGLGRLLQTVDALGGTTAFGYDRTNPPAQVSAPNGASTT